MVDAEAEVYETAKDIANVEKRVGSDSLLRPFVERLLLKVSHSFNVINNKCPSALDGRGFEGEDRTPNPVTRNYLVDIHARVKRAYKIHDREKA